MGVSEIFRTSAANAWRKFNRLNNFNTWVPMPIIPQLSNRYGPLPSKTVCTSATLYRVTIIMALRHKGTTLVSNKSNPRSICKQPLEEIIRL
jgi:hypothetical protein